MNVAEALHNRISVRAFKPDPVPEALLREILDVARFSPSGGNLQPWRVIVVTGAAQQAVTKLAQGLHQSGAPGEEGDHPVYPANLWEPYRTRRFKVGEDMYALLGIPREDKPGRLRQFARNLEFFGAPVGVFFVIDKRMGHGQWAHLGMFMQSIALTAIERGVASCFQEFWAFYRESVGKHFGLADNELLYCGMALGYADETAPVNTLRADRASVDEFTTFLK